MEKHRVAIKFKAVARLARVTRELKSSVRSTNGSIAESEKDVNEKSAD